jgi:Glutaminase
LWVELEDGRRLRVDPEDRRSRGFEQVLSELQQQRLPAYIEFDPGTSTITGIRIPYVSPVLALRAIGAGLLDVVLALSHARHFLRTDSEDFETLHARLDDAVRSREPVILVEDDAQQIIDVQPAPPSVKESGPPFPEKPSRPWWPWRWVDDILDRLRLWLCRWWPWWWWSWWCGCISAARAQQVFNDMQSTSCDPLTVPPPCIPFMYPDDGCWGRAHEMCRLMQLQGLRPRKVWIQGSLHVVTRNKPTCNVYWGWHVAPTLCVRGPGLWQRQDIVIDPSLFTTPVTEPQWKAVQGDLLATLTDTDASVFMLFNPAQPTDPTYALTNAVLVTYRLALQNRSINQGPPPYANCP